MLLFFLGGGVILNNILYVCNDFKEKRVFFLFYSPCIANMLGSVGFLRAPLGKYTNLVYFFLEYLYNLNLLSNKG